MSEFMNQDAQRINLEESQVYLLSTCEEAESAVRMEENLRTFRSIYTDAGTASVLILPSTHDPTINP